MLLDEQTLELKKNIRLNIELYNRLEREDRVSDLKLCESIVENSKYLIVLMTTIRDKVSDNRDAQLRVLDNICEDLKKIKSLRE